MWSELERFLAALQNNLQAPLPGRTAHARLAPRPLEGPPRDENPRADARHGGVMILFYAHENRLWLPFILRPTYNGVHSGQISFPGGGHEPEDENLVATALRETYEEIGVSVADIQVLGQLSPIYIAPSNFLVQPVIGCTPQRPDFRLDPYEVAGLIEVPVTQLADPANLRRAARKLRDERMADVPYFAIQEHVIWGATAMILSELLDLPALQIAIAADTIADTIRADAGTPNVTAPPAQSAEKRLSDTPSNRISSNRAS